jgi:hypothetical protein
LFDKFTPDTFHPKLFSLPSLVTEAVEIGQLQADQDAWGKHLKHVQEEIGERLDRGLERTLCSPRHLGMLERIRKSSMVSEVIGLGRVLELENFSAIMEAAVCQQFRDLNLTDVPKRKSEADTVLTALATYAFRRGCSAEDCQNVGESLTKCPDHIRDMILSCLPEKQSEFDCIVAVQAQTSISLGEVRAVCDHANVTRSSPKVLGLPAENDVIYFRRRVQGLRASGAVEALKNDIRAGLNLLALYKQTVAPGILQGGWVVEAEGTRHIPEANASFSNLHPRRDAVLLADQATAALANRREPAIRAALDLHNLALSMTDHRLRLVNLWSALECLASLMEGGSIIFRVERLVVPILTWRKIEKVVRYLSISVYFWLRDNPVFDRKSLPFRLGHHESVAPEQILTLLAEPENSTGILALLSLVSGHPLLCHRIFQAWKLFHEPEVLHADLSCSARRLGWHLWRIYRARNLLVHQGIEPPCLPQLANHLQQYFSWTLSRLLHGLTLGPEWTARDSWHYWKSKSDHVITSLSQQPQVLRVGDMFPEELQAPDFPIWK